MTHDVQDQVAAERNQLIQARQKGPGATLLVFLRLSGPGWFQSAITLGGGSLASSLYLGVLAGFTMLWLQPLAMLLGIVMLSAIGYVTLSTGKRPFQAINEHINPVLGWGWALATLAANMVWCLPQFSLATGVLQQNLAPELLGPDGPLGDFNAKLLISGTVLLITISITWAYDSGSWGVKLYEIVLKCVVASIVFCFLGVVLTLATSESGLDLAAVFAGFIPNWRQLFEPAPKFLPLLDEISQLAGEPVRQYWYGKIVAEQRDVMISAAATAVGINMTFLFPYSLLARGWDREFRGLSRFDLATGLLIPFVIATGCVTIAAASQFHAVPAAGLLGEVDQAGEPIVPPARMVTQFEGMLAARVSDSSASAGGAAQHNVPPVAASELVTPPERRLAAMLVKRDSMDLALALEPLAGPTVSHLVFGLGVLGMTLSTITLLMLISGFVICEILNLPASGWPHRLGCLAASVGALGPFVWGGRATPYLAVPTSIFGMMLLPIAYFTFFLLMNQKSLLGDELPRGGRRVVWNVLMFVAATTAGLASLWSVMARGGIYGQVALVAFVVLALVVQFQRRTRRATQSGADS